MINLKSPSPSIPMLLEIEKLVLDEISDFTPPNQGVNLCPAPEGHRDPIAKLLSSSRNKRFNSNCDSMIKMITHCDHVDCDDEDEDEDEDDEDDEDENDENSDSRNYHENGNEIDSNCVDDKRIRRKREGGTDDEDKEMDKEKERRKRKGKGLKLDGGGVGGGGGGLRNRIRRRRPTGDVDTNSGLSGMSPELFLHEEGYCLSPDPDYRSGSPSPVHLISGPNGHRSSNNSHDEVNYDVNETTRDQLKSPNVNQFLTHEPPHGCEKVNIVKDTTKRSIRPLNTLSHVVLAPCPQKPRNAGIVLLPSQSSAFLPLIRPPSDHLTHLDNITNRLNNTDLIGNVYKSIIDKNGVNN